MLQRVKVERAMRVEAAQCSLGCLGQVLLSDLR